MGKETRGKLGGIFLYSGSVVWQFYTSFSRVMMKQQQLELGLVVARAGGPYSQRKAGAHLFDEPTRLLNAVTENKFQWNQVVSR